MRKKWDYESCKKAAGECKTYREFYEKYPGAYEVSTKNGWEFIERKKKKNGYWTYEKCKEIADTCSSTTEFCNASKSAYDAARKKGWMWDWFERKSHGNNYWTYERCLEEASKYKTYSEFFKNDYIPYYKSRKNGWILDFTWLKNDTDNFDYEAKNHLIYSYVFYETNSVYVGLTYNLRERDKGHRKSRKNKNGKIYESSVKKHSLENNINIPKPLVLEKGLTINEAKEKEEYWINYYREKKFIILNKAKTGIKSGSIGGSKKKWTYENVYEEAKKYDSRTQFQKKSGGAYHAALKNDWIDDYEWLKPKIHANGYWTYERCLEEASKYETLKDFNMNSNSAYLKSTRNKWINKIKSELCWK